jgi:PAS domain S-box-containing protein
VSGNLIIDDRRTPIGYRGICRDITDQQPVPEAAGDAAQCTLEVYQATRAAERKYRAFIEFLPDPVAVFNMDDTVNYLNPAFESVFGWTLAELVGRKIPFVPGHRKEEMRQGIQRLKRENSIHGFKTQRLTKAGRLLDVNLSVALLYGEADKPIGQVLTLRDITQENRVARINQAMFRISQAVHQYRELDGLLAYITQEVKALVGVDGAAVILLDEEKQEFFFREADYGDSEASTRIKEIRFPVDEGVAGHVYRTGQPIIVPDTYKSPWFLKQVDQRAGFKTRNMLDTPLRIKQRMIGVLCAVNKKNGVFDDTDVELMTTIGNMVAMPLENVRINHELRRSYQEVKNLNRAKDRVIHHLSHELKTPASVLSASLNLLARKLQQASPEGRWHKIMDRAQRNLQRILDMQYAIEDILRDRQYQTHRLLTSLLDACSDELSLMVAEALPEADIIAGLRKRIDALFGPREAEPEFLQLDRFCHQLLEKMQPQLAHRKCRIEHSFQPVVPVLMPPEVVRKVFEGLVRNAVENTPDGGSIHIAVQALPDGCELIVRDAGIGITNENQRLLFKSYFTTDDPLNYSSRQPYDFNAGGKGFDLLRMQIFAERYGFEIKLESKRCDFLPTDRDLCPGDIRLCPHCRQPADCDRSGETIVSVFFPAANPSTDKG